MTPALTAYAAASCCKLAARLILVSAKKEGLWAKIPGGSARRPPFRRPSASIGSKIPFIDGKKFKVLLDTGANVNLISKKAAESLNFKPKEKFVRLNGLGQEEVTSTSSFQIPISDFENNKEILEFVMVDRLGKINQNVSEGQISEMTGVPINEFNFVQGEIDMIIGSPLLKKEKLWPREKERGEGFRLLTTSLSRRLIIHAYSGGGSLWKKGWDSLTWQCPHDHLLDGGAREDL